MSKNILVVGPSWVGDMIMAQSLFMLLKKQQDCKIDVLAPSWSSPILARMPEVANAIAMPIGHGELALRQRWQIAKKLCSHDYQLAYVLPNSFKSALIPFWAKIPTRVGWLGEMRFSLLNDIRVLDKAKYPKMVERFVALASPKGKLPLSYSHPKLKVVPEEVAKVKDKFNLATAGRTILALFPGAEFGKAKRWPTKYYAEVAKEKLAEGSDVWLLGSKKDAAIADEIQNLSQGKCINLVGKTTLAEAIDIISLIDMAISNDSGLLHLAAALAKPVVAIYGPTAPSFAPPLSTNAKIVYNKLPCSPCAKRECPLQHNDCMWKITPKLVMRELANLDTAYETINS